VSRVLVTGATGFIGRGTLAPLRALGYEVHAVARRERSGAGITWHVADLLDPDATARVVAAARPSHLLHLAWYAEHGRFWTSPENVRWVEATLALMRAFTAAGGRRAVIAGTSAEYDWDHGFCSEAVTPLRPATLYGIAKDATRRVASAAAEQAGVSLAWGRVFFLYGPGEHPDRLVASVARALMEGRPAETSSGIQVRDFMHVDDVAGAFAVLLDSGAEGAVNIASGEPVRVREVVEELARAAGRPDLPRLGALPDRAGEPPLLVADVRRLRDEVGFTPAWSLPAGLAQTLGGGRA
jgi:nucleoside-diphosphate-sugar epimerase